MRSAQQYLLDISVYGPIAGTIEDRAIWFWSIARSTLDAQECIYVIHILRASAALVDPQSERIEVED